MNRDSKSSSVGTSFFDCLGPFRARYRSRSSAHRLAADLDCTGAFKRSRYLVPSGSRTRMSTWSQPPSCSTTRIVIALFSCPAMTHAWLSTLAGPTCARRGAGRARWWAGADHESASRKRCRPSCGRAWQPPARRTSHRLLMERRCGELPHELADRGCEALLGVERAAAGRAVDVRAQRVERRCARRRCAGRAAPLSHVLLLGRSQPENPEGSRSGIAGRCRWRRTESSPCRGLQEMLLHTSYLTQCAQQPIQENGLDLSVGLADLGKTAVARRAHDQLMTYCLTLLYERWSEGDVLCYK